MKSLHILAMICVVSLGSASLAQVGASFLCERGNLELDKKNGRRTVYFEALGTQKDTVDEYRISYSQKKKLNGEIVETRKTLVERVPCRFSEKNTFVFRCLDKMHDISSAKITTEILSADMHGTYDDKSAIMLFKASVKRKLRRGFKAIPELDHKTYPISFCRRIHN